MEYDPKDPSVGMPDADAVPDDETPGGPLGEIQAEEDTSGGPLSSGAGPGAGDPGEDGPDVDVPGGADEGV